MQHERLSIADAVVARIGLCKIIDRWISIGQFGGHWCERVSLLPCRIEGLSALLRVSAQSSYAIEKSRPFVSICCVGWNHLSHITQDRVDMYLVVVFDPYHSVEHAHFLTFSYNSTVSTLPESSVSLLTEAWSWSSVHYDHLHLSTNYSGHCNPVPPTPFPVNHNLPLAHTKQYPRHQSRTRRQSADSSNFDIIQDLK